MRIPPIDWDKVEFRAALEEPDGRRVLWSGKIRVPADSLMSGDEIKVTVRRLHGEPELEVEID